MTAPARLEDATAARYVFDRRCFDLINISRTALASQSSLSEWSQPDEAARALTGEPTGRFSFHTAQQQDPWWMVEFHSPFPITRIELFNREDAGADRVIPLTVQLRLGLGEWKEIARIGYAFGGAQSGSPMVLDLPQPVEANALRLVRRGEACLHLDKVNVYSSWRSIPSYSQEGQDRWVVGMLGGKRSGYFVDIGATDGVEKSNTFVLERIFGWSGVCIEPNPSYFYALKENRSALSFEVALTNGPDGETDFLPLDEYGSLTKYADVDAHSGIREQMMREIPAITVHTTSINKLLADAKAPSLIDFMSIDTEGAEQEILESLSFDDYRICLLVVEHNLVQEKREAIYERLSQYGFARTEAGFDDWYHNPRNLALASGEYALTPEQYTKLSASLRDSLIAS